MSPADELFAPYRTTRARMARLAADLGVIGVRDNNRTLRSHDSEPGWTLEVAPWEAVRALYSRRTADELRGLPHHGNVEPYLAILDAHLPLPTTSLNEPWSTALANRRGEAYLAV